MLVRLQHSFESVLTWNKSDFTVQHGPQYRMWTGRGAAEPGTESLTITQTNFVVFLTKVCQINDFNPPDIQTK